MRAGKQSRPNPWSPSTACLAIIALLGIWSVPARTLAQEHRLSQYAHMAWRVQDGFEVGASVTQTADGHLWFGTSGGLLRFDGVKFVPYDLPPITPALRGLNYLLGARDGSLWIGTQNGLARLKDGKLEWYSDAAQHTGISAILEDPEGTIWLTRYHVPRGQGPLCRVKANGLHCYGEADGIPVRYGVGLARDNEGNLWFGSSALCRWRPGSASTYLNYISKRPDAGNGVIDVAAGPFGEIWATTEVAAPGMGVLSSSGGSWKTYVIPGFDGSKVGSHTLFMDREHSLWIGTTGDGLYRVHDGTAQHYGTADGLSGKDINLIYEDHEGNIWVLTDDGIDMFRDTAVVTYSQREGLSGAATLSVLGLKDGSLWSANWGGVIDIFKEGHHSTLPAKGAFDETVTTLFEDRKGVVWLGRNRRLFAYNHGRFREFKRPDGSRLEEGLIDAITEDTKGNIWVLTDHHNVFRIENGTAVQVLTASSDNRPSGALAPDHQGGIWIASRNDTLTYYKDGSVRTISLNRPDASFSIHAIIVDSDDALLVATTDGLFRWDDRRLEVLDSLSGLPSNLVYSVLRDNDGAVWVRCQKGLARISENEFDKWRHQSGIKPVMEVFDKYDGARSGRGALMTQPPATKTADGRLWFVAGRGVQMIDPKHTFRNSIPPPVYIVRVAADSKEYGIAKTVELPAFSRSVQIDYTALSLAVPQKVFFKYQLVGHDAEWQEAGTRRQAFYTDLPPGPYRFRVIASNNDGVWNETGAQVAFTITPAFTQGVWFKAISLLGFAAFVYLAYRVRVRQVTGQLRGRMYERIAERKRIARDLHDTFFQGIQGLLLRFHTATSLLHKDEPARTILEQALSQSDQVMLEGRELVLDLRATASERNDLPTALADFGEGMQKGSSQDFRVIVNGDIHPLHPIVFEELFKIGKEALRNAFRHSGAHSIEAKLNYEPSELRIRIRDDGEGIESAILERGHRDGHFGLPGMKERAKKIGAHVDIWSRTAAGTEVELRMAARLAYIKPDGFNLWNLRRLWRGSKQQDGPGDRGYAPS